MPAKKDEPDYNTLYQLYCIERLTTRQIGKQLNASKTTVQQWLRVHNIQVRPTGHGLDNRGITPPTRDELHNLVHEQHLSYIQISAIYKVDQSAVQHWLKKHNIPRPKIWDTRHKGQVPTLPNENELRNLYETAGMSLVEIGERYNVSPAPIRRLCEEYNIPIRQDGWEGGKRFACIDGHLVRSTYEQKVDNWLHVHAVEHVYEPPIPSFPQFHADFFANGWYIEVWGVTNDPEYEKRKTRKQEIYKAMGLFLIEIPYHSFAAKTKERWQRKLTPCLTSTFKKFGYSPPE